MKTPEKLDLLLKHLYHCNDNEYHSLNQAVQNIEISLRISEKLGLLAKKMKSDKLIEFMDIRFDIKARITEAGLLFCETTSYAYEGYPIITHLPHIMLESRLIRNKQ